MQIHLKQNEIEAALKLFVSQQGINLANKTIQMEFTAGRKESGISVEMTIAEVYSVSPQAATTPLAATLINATPSVTVNGAAPTQEATATGEVAVPVVKAASLFNT